MTVLDEIKSHMKSRKMECVTGGFIRDALTDEQRSAIQKSIDEHVPVTAICRWLRSKGNVATAESAAAHFRRDCKCPTVV